MLATWRNIGPRRMATTLVSLLAMSCLLLVCLGSMLYSATSTSFPQYHRFMANATTAGRSTFSRTTTKSYGASVSPSSNPVVISNSSVSLSAPTYAARQSAARVRWLQDACLSLGIRDRKKLARRRNKYDHILIDDANRMLFCDAPKTGSSFFKILWLNYTREVYQPRLIHERSFLAKHNLRYLNSYSQAGIQTRLETYFKFMVVRHPFVRILSTYIEKLEKPNEYYQPLLGRTIERKYSNVPARQATGKNVSFSQMVQYIVDSGPYDHHWTPVSLLCNPCEIAYDYIAKLETSHVDYKHIFSKLKNVPGSKTGLLGSVTAYRGATDLDMVRKYYKTVPINVTNSLFQTYNTDFELFGYTWNTTSQSYGDRMNADGKEY